MRKLIVYLLVLEVGGLLGFIVVSTYPEIQSLRYFPILMAAGGVFIFSFNVAPRLTIKQVAYSSIIVSLLFVLALQALGFTIFPGLVKDMELISVDNVARMGLMILIGVISHFVLLMSAHRFGRAQSKP